MAVCPICQSEVSQVLGRWLNQTYLSCSECLYIFVPKADHLSRAEEKAIYDLHENFPDDPRYRQFLAQLVDPLHEQLGASSEGLDYGCGPGPALSIMLEEAGHQVELYDVYYYPDKAPLARKYDFITMTEVAEHLAHPREVLGECFEKLRPGGLLAIMTKFLPELDMFSTWGYKNDPTHIGFFHEKTFVTLASLLNAEVSFPAKNVAFLKRSSSLSLTSPRPS